MKTKIVKPIKAIVLLILLVSCGSSEKAILNSDRILSNTEFGYSAFQPIPIGAPTNDEVNVKIYKYLDNLRSEKGNKLEIIQDSTVSNPNYKDPKIKIYDIFTSEIINRTSSKNLEVYTLLPNQEKDTIHIYFDPFIKGPLMAPNGLSFATND